MRGGIDVHDAAAKKAGPPKHSYAADAADRRGFALWDAVAGLTEILPHPPLTRNQVELMQIDTTASDDLPGLRELGISPRSLEEELEAMLKQSNTETQLLNRRRGS